MRTATIIATNVTYYVVFLAKIGTFQSTLGIFQKADSFPLSNSDTFDLKLITFKIKTNVAQTKLH